MKNSKYNAPFADDEFAVGEEWHLPLDWNEELSLEEYLNKLERGTKK